MDGKAVSKAREVLGLNQPEFAKKINVQPSTVWRWETDRAKPRPRHALAIKTAVRVFKAALVVNSANPTSPTNGVGRIEAQVKEVAQEEIPERSNHVEVEQALMSATAQVTAAWIAGHTRSVPVKDVAAFVLQISRSLRKD